jgi:hypothetical protein
MATLMIHRPVTLEEAVTALQDRLGDGYTITPHRNGSNERIHVQRALAMANVHLVRDGDSTRFRVHGSGIIVNRLFNEFGLARRVGGALQTLSPPPPSPRESP